MVWDLPMVVKFENEMVGLLRLSLNQQTSPSFRKTWNYWKVEFLYLRSRLCDAKSFIKLKNVFWLKWHDNFTKNKTIIWVHKHLRCSHNFRLKSRFRIILHCQRRPPKCYVYFLCQHCFFKHRSRTKPAQLA